MLSKQEYLNKLKDIKLISVDVDGTMTDGSLYYMDDGSQARRYDVKDGVGLFLMQAAGVKAAMMTTGSVGSIQIRGEKLAMDYVEISIYDKAARLKEICTELGITMDEVAHIGDDINDIPAFKAVGLALIVGDAAKQTYPYADYRLNSHGGAGAIRELAEDYYEIHDKEVSWDVVEAFIHSRSLSNG